MWVDGDDDEAAARRCRARLLIILVLGQQLYFLSSLFPSIGVVYNWNIAADDVSF